MRLPLGAQVVQDLLSRNEWSQAHLARLCSVSRGTVSLWLSGRRTPSRRSLLALRRALGRTIKAEDWDIDVEVAP